MAANTEDILLAASFRGNRRFEDILIENVRRIYPRIRLVLLRQYRWQHFSENITVLSTRSTVKTPSGIHESSLPVTHTLLLSHSYKRLVVCWRMYQLCASTVQCVTHTSRDLNTGFVGFLFLHSKVKF
jgi:hypothetical protein